MKNKIIAVLLILVWVFTGVFTLNYWWTRERDLDVTDAIFMTVLGAGLGPSTLLLFIGDLPIWDKVVIKKRGENSKEEKK